MRRWDSLNDRQLAVLQRIAGGDDLRDANNAARRSAAALRDRGLITISRRDGWHATLTHAGPFYLEHGHHPDRPPSSLPAPTPASPNTQTTRQARTNRHRTMPHVSARQLMDQLRDNAGTVTVADPDATTRAAWRRAIHAAKKDRLVPSGYHLRHHGRDTGDLLIELIECEHPDTTQWSPRQQLAVPDSIDQPHPVIAKLRRHPDHIYVTEASRDRALRILQALLTEWERRGHKAELGDDHGGIVMVIAESRYTLQMSEERKPVKQLPSADKFHQKTDSWQRVQPTIREVGTGQLVLELPHDWQYSGHRRRWADRTRWTLEDKLIDVLTELEVRALLDHEQHIANLEEQARRQQEWEAAIAKAQGRFAEDIRIKALTEQVTSWENAARIRAYCNALQSATPHNEDGDIADWIQWARHHADRIDPLARNRFHPDIPEPQPSDLKPYLDHHNPYGPNSSY